MYSRQLHARGARRIGSKLALAAGLMSLLPWAVAAAHGPGSRIDGPAVVVRYADLDIATRFGAELLYQRIQQAAAQLCPQVGFEQLQRHAASLRCRNEIVAHAVNSIDSAQLAAVYAAHTHHAGHGAV